ncbi:MAG: cobalamin biosynthesis protein CobD [Candidatus Eremiobacteraeota bacterium]|nr:cobalamin biosynthesis protein CobD [Candidatus Eremiobacteraeota bacterium]
MMAEVLAGVVLDLAIGDPPGLPHPVRFMGAAIACAERVALRRRRPAAVELVAGATLTIALVTASVLFAAAVRRVGGTVALAVLAASTIAVRSLDESVSTVLAALERDDVPSARVALGEIVGRDVDDLDAGAIAAAAIESLAESLCDGVATPLLLLAAFGTEAALGFKAVSTLDSMIGHREAPYTWFGSFAARADDVANYLPARLVALTIALCAPLAGGDVRRALSTLRHAGRHASPNAGWPEAAMAGALGIRLGGPATYGGAPIVRAHLGSGAAPQARDLRRALHLGRAVAAALIVTALVTSHARRSRR